MARGLETPLGLGRIWRVVPKGEATHPIEDLSALDSIELAKQVVHSNGSVRDQVQRLLVEQKDAKAVPLLEEIATSAPLGRDRIKALWTLDGMGFLTRELVIEATKDDDSMVRTHALRLAEQWRNATEIVERFNQLKSDSNSLVRRQAALSSAVHVGPAGIDFLLELSQQDDRQAIQSAVFASLSGREQESLDRISINKALTVDNQANRQLLQQLISVLLNERSAKTNSLIIECMTKQINRAPWQSEVILQQLAAYIEKSKQQFKLQRKPSRWLTFFKTVSGEAKAQALVINPAVWWPNRTDVNEVIKSAVSNEVHNLRTRGKKVYNICKTCHQVDGLGLPPTYPPLAESEYVIGDADTIIKIMLHGLSGPLEMEGVRYEDYMPPAPVKNDYDIAAVITYVRQAWGNNAGPVTPAEVAAIRKEYKGRQSPWSVEELIN